MPLLDIKTSATHLHSLIFTHTNGRFFDEPLWEDMRPPIALNQPQLPYRVVRKRVRFSDGTTKVFPVKVYKFPQDGGTPLKVLPSEYGLGDAFSF